ncbi:MATH domain and coiled-coil domain-containing protein At3g58210-like, partial [Daucus carota subsp. sativus]|uniref:MATH domain and coiled-coil domain-containing protein At3g58210-like n=1 Tax=Daucus carota subsp. sativus TaxID=79200 RepID=UPI003082AD58
MDFIDHNIIFGWVKSISLELLKTGVVRYLRDAPPAHYLVKIESFSRLANSGLEKCESAVFDASGYKWRLVLYPNGNTKRGGGGHISLYLAIDSDSLPLGWEAYVTYKMFVFDHHKDKYLTIQGMGLYSLDDSVHQIRRFHEAKKESGFDRLISLDTFNAARNGYLVDDQCVYGVEVHEVKYTGNGETFKMIEDPEDVTFDWMITDFSTMCREKLKSEKIDSE